ncbi:MAG: hypothetical protein ACOX4W_00640 [Bacilli bacterium]
MKILKFLKIFVSPLRMARYRNMSLLISISLWLFLAGNIISIPSVVYYKNHIYETVEKNQNDTLLDFDVLSSIPEEDTTFQTFFTEWNCSVNNNIFSCNNYIEHPMTVISFSKPNSNDELINYNIKLIIDILPESEEVDVRFPVSDAFVDLPETDQNYLFVFYETSFLYKIPKSSSVGAVKSNTRFEVPYSKANGDGAFSITGFGENSHSAGIYLTRRLSETVFYELLKLNLTLMGFIVCFFWPLLLTLILWILFKKSGKLETYKEFYNIATLSSIVPILLVFTITWFYPGALDYFIPIYSFYTMFVIYKINNSSTATNDDMLISP